MTKTAILFATETGNAEFIALHLHDKVKEAIGGESECAEMTDFDAETLPSYDNIIIVTATHGDGELPAFAFDFWDACQGLTEIKSKFAICGLGDKDYEYFNKAAEIWEEFLISKGGTMVMDTLKLDVDFEDSAMAWTDEVVTKF